MFSGIWRTCHGSSRQMVLHDGVGNQPKSKDIFISLILVFTKAMWCCGVSIDETSYLTTLSTSELIIYDHGVEFFWEGGCGCYNCNFVFIAFGVWFIDISMTYGTMSDPRWGRKKVPVCLCCDCCVFLSQYNSHTPFHSWITSGLQTPLW